MNNRHTKQGESVYMSHVIYFDVETQRSAEEVGGWDHVERLGLALAVTYDTRDNTYKTYDEASVTNLVEALSAADLVIGFNHLKFDYRVLSAYTNADLHSLPNFDMLAQLFKDEGFRVGLDELGQHTLDRAKTAHGLQSIEWWKRGEMDKVAEYCKQDVALTRELFLHARNKGYLLCGSGNGVSRLDTKHWKGIVRNAIRSGTLEAIRRDIIDALSVGDEDEIQVLMGNLDTLYSERREKLEGYSHVIRNAEAEAKALRTRVKALSKLAKLLRGTLIDDMRQHGETQTNAGRFRLQRGNKARVVLDIDAVDLPEAYQHITADKTALRRVLIGGEAIEGVELESTEFVSIFRRTHRTRRQHPLPSQADTGAGADNSGPAIKVSDRLLDIHNRVDRLYKSSDLSKICADYARKCADAADAGEPEPVLTEWEQGELYRIAEEYESMGDEIHIHLSGKPDPTEWEESKSMLDAIEDQLYGEYELTERYREQLEEQRHQLIEELAEGKREELEWERDQLKSIADAIVDVLYGE